MAKGHQLVHRMASRSSQNCINGLLNFNLRTKFLIYRDIMNHTPPITGPLDRFFPSELKESKKGSSQANQPASFTSTPLTQYDHKSQVSRLASPAEETITHIYSDGSCQHNGKPNAKAGVGVYFGPSDVRNISEPLLEKPSNQRAELTAILRVYQTVEKHKMGNQKIIIHTDSQYSIKCLTKYIKNWLRNGWMTASKKPVQHRDLIETLHHYGNKYPKVMLRHIRAHTGKTDSHSLGNEAADKLAADGCPA